MCCQLNFHSTLASKEANRHCVGKIEYHEFDRKNLKLANTRQMSITTLYNLLGSMKLHPLLGAMLSHSFHPASRQLLSSHIRHELKKTAYKFEIPNLHMNYKVHLNE